MRRVSTAAPAGTIHANFRLRLELKGALMLGALLATMGIFLAFAPAASAAKEPFAVFGGPIGSSGGEFSQPRGIAVNQSGNGAPAGTFYVVDANNNRVQQFSPAGDFIRAWGWGVRNGEAEFEVCTIAAKCLQGTAGDNAGQLSGPQGIAVDPSTGNVFVSNNGSRRISVFSPSGVFMGAFGWGALDGDESLQFCTMGTGCGEPGPEAEAEGDVGGGQFGTIGGLATDAEGNLYVANRTSRRVDVFRPLLTGTSVTGVEFLRSFGWGAATGADEFQVCAASPCSAPAGTGTAPGQFGANSPSDVAVDSAGNIYALDFGNKRVQKFSGAPAPLNSAFGTPALTSTFAAGNRIAIAVDPDTGHVFVLGNRSASGNRVAIQELDELGAAVETHGATLTANVAGGLAAASHSNGGTLYLSSSAEFLHRVFALNGPLKPTIGPVTGISSTEATFSGEVVSEEVDTAYRFEYSSDGINWTSGSEETVAAQPGSATVQESVSGLEPNKEYRVRLRAERPAGSWVRTSSSATFTTDPLAPAVAGGIATQITNTSARLVAYLNPNNSPTTYRFEYGTTEAYGSVAPVPAASAGEGGKQVTVSHVVAGLAPATTYHFRVVAENAAGQPVGPDITFTTGSFGPALTPRAYELVSPVDSNGQDVNIESTSNKPTAAIDGEAVLFMTWGPPLGTEAGGYVVSHVARREADGWSMKSLSPIQNPDPLGGSTVQYPSDYLTDFAILGPLSPQPAPGGGEGRPNLFHYNLQTDTFRTISVGTAPKETGSKTLEAVGGSSDLNTVVFDYQGAAPLVEGVDPGTRSPYVWKSSDGSLDAVAREPVTNQPFEDPSRLGSYRRNDNAVSADGSKVFFQARPGGPRRIYVRIDGSETKELSASQRTVPDPEPGEARFGFASEDGSIAFFTSEQDLTDDATTGLGIDLYRYEVETGKLTDITVDPTAGDGAQVQGVIAGADDASRLYFVAQGVLAPGAQAGANNVYLWTDDGSPGGKVEFVAPDAEEANFSPSLNPHEGRSPARTTPDGSKLLFTSRQSLTDYPTNESSQGYLYDAETGLLACVTCNPLGGPITADADLRGTGDLMKMAHTLSDDGRRVFFTSRERMTEEDEDTGDDVYEYVTRGGGLTLLSSGQSDQPSNLQDASDDGRDVFFTTRDRLVGVDRDETLDIYDARIGGGLAGQNPPPPPPPCGPGECQAPTPVAPPAAPGSAAIQGPGNASQPGKRAQKPKKKCKKQGKGKKRGKRCKGKRHGRR